jgi:DNA-binding NarL/FixJ family response regulator
MQCASASHDEALAVIRVLVVQDHPLLASAITGIVDCELDMTTCGVERTGAGAVAAATREKAAVILMDYNLPDMTGAAAATLIRARSPQAAIVFHSTVDCESAYLDAVDAGAAAYLTKSANPDRIVESIRRAASGEVLIPVAMFAKAVARRRALLAGQNARNRLAARFTTRELDVLKLLAQGLDTSAMAQRLGIAPHTIEWHIRHVIEKMEVHSKLQAVIAAARSGLIDLAER